MKIKLASDLEKALLRAIAEGLCPADIITPEELSKNAKVIYESIRYLLEKKASAPLRPTSILLTAESLFGVDKAEFKEYLSSFSELEVGSEVSAILRSAREKTLLVQLINEAGAQLAKGHLDVREISRRLEKGNHGTTAARPLAEEIKDKFPKPPRGIVIRTLARISEATNGLIGIWIIGGEPGLGKSTLALQLALDAGFEIPVFYFDLDGTGREWTIDRIRRIAGSSLKVFKKLTRRFHFRETIATLDDDIAYIKRAFGDGKPALFVIDSIQTLPSSIKYRKESLDSWIARFKSLTKQGLIFLCVSEQNRAHYGEASMGGYKGSGDIEYAGSLCAQLLQDEDADQNDPVKFVIVKNRHGKKKGHIVDLERDKKREFWFNEEEPEID